MKVETRPDKLTILFSHFTRSSSSPLLEKVPAESIGFPPKAAFYSVRMMGLRATCKGCMVLSLRFILTRQPRSRQDASSPKGAPPCE